MPRDYPERKDIFNMYKDSEIIKRYGLDRGGIMLVTDLVRDLITSPTIRNQFISAEVEVLTTLRYLTTGKMQVCNCDDIGLFQQASSNVMA